MLAEEGYAALAAEVLQLFIDDIPAEDIKAMTARAYSYPKFASEEIVPVTELEPGILIGHLSEGPTAASKDMAMQLLGELFEYELAAAAKPSTLWVLPRAIPVHLPNTPCAAALASRFSCSPPLAA